MHRIQKALASLAVLSIALNAQAAVRKADVIVKVGDVPAGGGGGAVATLNAPFTNGDGKVGFTGNLTPTNNFVWLEGDIIWLNSNGLPAVLTGAEGTMGISNSGDFIYSPAINGNDGVWTDAGALAQDTDPAPGIPGNFIVFCSRPIMIPNGDAFFVSGIGTTQGGATQRRVMYRSTAGVLAPVYIGGDPLGGFTVATQGIDFGYDFSNNGLHYIQQFTMTGVPTTMDVFMYVDGAAVAREGTPTGQGANWASFTGPSVNNAGNYAFGSDDSGATATDVSVVYNGVPAVREGDTIDGFNIAAGTTVGWVSINNQNKVAYILNRTGFDALLAGDGPNLATTSKLFLQVGDTLDINNDTVPDVTVMDFEASATIGPGICLSDHNYIYLEVTLRDIGGAVDYEAIIRVPIPKPCIADIAPQPNGNLFVNVDDLLLVINNWGPCPRPCPPNCFADVVPPGGNCFVNVDDLLFIINSWGQCP